jgi:serine/threonine protein kinase
VLATRTILPSAQPASRSPETRLDEPLLLRKLEGGLRAEVWLGLAPGTADSDAVVLIKRFFPHVSGPALDGLRHELELAKRLEHENIARHLHVDPEPEHPAIVSEYLEGTSLQTLLLRAHVAGLRLPQAAVARVLIAVIEAVVHAEGRAASVAERAIVHQLVAAEDVFVGYDGSVKLLGFKSNLRATGWSAPGCCAEPCDVASPAAIDALLSEHFSSEVGAALAAANDTNVRRLDRLAQVARALRRWQADQLGSDGRAELVALMQILLPTARLEQRARLEAALQHASATRDSSGAPLPDQDEAPPVSGIRRRSDAIG